MPSVANPNELEFTAKNGFRSHVTAHPDRSDFFVAFLDAWCDQQGRIRKRFGRATAGASGVAAITALWEFEYVDATTGLSTFYIFRTNSTKIQRYSAGNWLDETLPYTPTSGVRWQFCNFKNRCFAVNGDTDATKGQMIMFDPAVDSTKWFIVGQSAPAAAATYSLAGSYATGTITGYTQGSAVINGTGTAWDNSGAWNGKWIDINGIRYKISNVNTGAQIQLTEAFKEASAGPALTYTIYFGLMDWTVAPRYAYAYFNPTTGHVSNASPVLQITEQNVVGQTPTITIAGSAANTNAYNAGYTQIKIFRPPQNGYRLLAINVTVNNRNDGAAITFTENANTYQDVNLTEFAMPINTNTKPPVGLSAITEYQGRLFVNKPTDTPPGWYFSAINEELPFGRGEESFPARFKRNVTRPAGLLTVAGKGITSSLVGSTGNGDFTLEGVDNLSYTNPLKMQTRGSGGFLGGMAEVHGGLVEFYRDKRVIDFLLGKDLTSPCQDRFEALNAANIGLSRLAWYAYATVDFLLISFPKGAGQATNNYTIVYDYDEDQLYEWNFGFSAAAVVHNPTGTGDLELWLGDAAGNTWKIITTSTQFSDAGLSNYTPTIKTCHIRREGVVDRLAEIELFVGPIASNPQNLTWTVNIYMDESTSVSRTYTASAIGGIYESSQTMKLHVVPDVPLRSHVYQVEVIFPATSTDLAIDMMRLIFADDQEDAVEP